MALYTLIFLALVAYVAGVGIYRLSFSPLAKYPGPKLAALTRLYEGYYDIVLRGQFKEHVDKLHDQYGTIVRIGPEEVHIKDPSFWDEVFARRPKADKPKDPGNRFANWGAGFATIDAARHRALRAPLNPFFSRRSLLEQQGKVQATITSMCEGFQRASGPFNLADAYAAMTCDVVYDFAFGFNYGQVESEGFKKNFAEQFTALTEFGNISVVFVDFCDRISQSVPMDKHIEKYTPKSWIAKVPLLAMMDELKQDFLRTVRKDKRAFEDKETREDGRITMFNSILASDLPPNDKADLRLAQEAQVIIGGGILTSAWSLTSTTYYILANPDVLSKLQKELKVAIPDMSEPGAFNYEKLERLPYLTGCVKEGIRISEPISGRLHRVFHEPLPYKDWQIPPEVTVSMNVRDVTSEESIFPDARQYKPQRWLPGAAKAPDGSSLDSWLVSFSRGPRMCLGQPLAYMEAYVTLAQIFRRFDLKLYETDQSDVVMAHDFWIPVAKLDSKGVRVQVVGNLA